MAAADLTITLPRPEGLALADVAEQGRTVADVLGLVQNLSTSTRAIDKVQAATRAKGGGKVTMTRTEALALVNVAEIGRKVGDGLRLIDNLATTRKAISRVQDALQAHVDA